MMYWITSTLNIKSGAFASGNIVNMAIISILADIFIVYVVVVGLYLYLS